MQSSREFPHQRYSLIAWPPAALPTMTSLSITSSHNNKHTHSAVECINCIFLSLFKVYSSSMTKRNKRIEVSCVNILQQTSHTSFFLFARTYLNYELASSCEGLFSAQEQKGTHTLNERRKKNIKKYPACSSTQQLVWCWTSKRNATEESFVTPVSAKWRDMTAAYTRTQGKK